MGIKTDDLGGTDWVDGNVLTAADLVDTIDANTEAAMKGTTQVPYTTLKSNGAWTNEGNLAADRTTVAAGINGTISASGTAVFDTNKYVINDNLDVYVIIEATSLTESVFRINDCDIVEFENGKWGVYSTIGTAEERRAKIYKTLFYGTSGSNPAATSSNITGITAIKTSVARDVGKSGFYTQNILTSNIGDRDYQGTFSNTTDNNDVSHWSYVNVDAPTNDGEGFFKINGFNYNGGTDEYFNDETENDLSADELNNPSTVLLEIDTYGPSFNSVTIKAFILSKGSISWSAIQADAAGWNYSNTDFNVDQGIPTFTEATETISSQVVCDTNTLQLDGTESLIGVYTDIITPTDTSLKIQFQELQKLYDSGNSFDLSEFSGNNLGLYFKLDGTKMYKSDNTTDSVYQYTLSTPWDVSTASYDSVSFSILSQDTNMYGLYFKPDGTKMYGVGLNSDSVYQYTLSTAWDLSTISYDSVSFSVGGQTNRASEVFFKPDGMKMYIWDYNGIIYQYTLSTPWGVSTASYDSVSFTYTTSTSFGMVFNNNGKKFYVVGYVNNTIFQFDLSTAWDLSTASYDKQIIGPYDKNMMGIYLSPNGENLYLSGSSSDNMVNQYILPLAGDLNSITNISDVYNLNESLIIPLNNTVNENSSLGITFILETTDTRVTPELYGYGIYKI